MEKYPAAPGTARPCGAIHRLLQEALGQLPEADRRIIEPLYWGRTTETEIARSLGVSQQTVSNRKLAVLRTLRERIVQVTGRETVS